MVVVKVHRPSRLQPAIYRVPHGNSAFVQHLRDALRVALGQPLFLGHVLGELGSVLEDEHEPHIVHVGKQLSDGWAAVHRPDLQPAFRDSAEEVDQDRVVPVPGVE